MMSAVDDDRAVTPPGAERNLRRLGQDFYRHPAVDCATDFLGKVLVHDTAAGRLAGAISDVEAYPAFVDGVHHGNKRTARSEVMWGPGGRAYVYLVYGIWHQFAAVVNSEDVPDVVFISAVAPVEGADVMAAQWNNPVETKALANSPGKLCRSFAITTEHYGADLCRYELFLEDWGLTVPAKTVRTSKRIGISSRHYGHDSPLRHHLRPADTVALLRAWSEASQRFVASTRAHPPAAWSTLVRR